MVGRMQLSNSQKLAERQSCYSGPKENLIEDKRRRRKRPTKEIRRKDYIRQNRGKEEINLVAQLKARYQRKEDNVKRQRHRLKSTNQEWRQSHAVPIKLNTTKKKAPPDQTPIKPNKGSALPSKGKT